MTRQWKGNQTVSEEVAEHLRSLIQQGVLQPGQRLQQNQLAEEFGVSSTPVREAFAKLQAQGLVRVDRYRGAVVFQPTVADLVEAHEIREALETMAVRKAVPNLTGDDLAALEDLVGRMERADDEWIDLNHEFHLRLYQAAGSPRLVGLIESLRATTNAYLHLFKAMTSPQHRGDDEHREILRSALAGDADAAETWTRAHIRSTVDKVVERLNDDGQADHPARDRTPDRK